MGAYVDVLKFAGGSFSLMPRKAVKELLEVCHSHNVLVFTVGFIEHVPTQGPDPVGRYIEECKRLAFDIVEIRRASSLFRRTIGCDGGLAKEFSSVA